MNAVYDLKFLSPKTQTTREYNLVRHTFYGVNYIYMYMHAFNKKERNLKHELYRRLTIFSWVFSAREYFRTKI